MSHHVNIIAFGTFGNPNGFKQTFFNADADRSLAKNIKTFDLKTDAIRLFPNSRLYSIRKESVNGNDLVAYSVYSFAKEQGSERGGTFIGSSLLFSNKVAEEAITVNCLTEFHDYLEKRNVQQDIIKVAHSDQFQVRNPKDFTKIDFNLKEIDGLDFMTTNDKYLVVFCEINRDSLSGYFKKTLGLLSLYSTIYFTSNAEVAKFVNDRGLFTLIQDVGEKRDLDKELAKLMEEKRQKVAAFITELDIEKQKIERDQATTTEWYQTWITQSEKQHYENSKKIEDGKKLATNMQQTYHGYLKKLSESISRLKANEKPDMERRSLNEYKRDFIDAIGKQQVPQALLAVSMTENSATVKARPSFISEFESFDSRENKKYKRSGANEFNIYKVLTIVLVFLLLSAVAFGCFFMEIVM